MFNVYRQSDALLLGEGFKTRKAAINWGKRSFNYLPKGYWYVDRA